MSSVSIYACGGAGTNILQKSLELSSLIEMPELNLSVIDTSRSNISVNLEKENIGSTFVDGLNGGGKDQRLAFDHAQPYVNDHLNRNKPGDFNIVLFSLSGASGSSTGSLITAELLKRNVPVVCFVIGSVEDGKQAENTYKSLVTLQNLSKAHKLPLTIAYHENKYDGQNTARVGGEEYINEAIFVGIRDLCRLVSEKHHGLDREDIRNWLYFNKISNTVGLVELFTASTIDGMEHVKGKVITSASLLASREGAVPSLMQPYSCKGYISEALAKDFGEDFDGVHYLITKGFIKGPFSHIKSKVAEFKAVLDKLQDDNNDLDDELDDLGDSDSPFSF